MPAAFPPRADARSHLLSSQKKGFPGRQDWRAQAGWAQEARGEKRGRKGEGPAQQRGQRANYDADSTHPNDAYIWVLLGIEYGEYCSAMLATSVARSNPGAVGSSWYSFRDRYA